MTVHETLDENSNLIDAIRLDPQMHASFVEGMRQQSGNPELSLSERIYNLPRAQASAAANIMRGILMNPDPNERIMNTGVTLISPEGEDAPTTMLFVGGHNHQPSLELGTDKLVAATNQQLEALGSPLRFGE